MLKNFIDVIAFLDALALECERLDHHPKIFTVCNKVGLTLTTFDSGRRISSDDVLLAGRIEALAPFSPTEIKTLRTVGAARRSPECCPPIEQVHGPRGNKSPGLTKKFVR